MAITFRKMRSHSAHEFFPPDRRSQIVIHKAEQPNTFFDFFETNSLTSEYRTEINLFAV